MRKKPGKVKTSHKKTSTTGDGSSSSSRDGRESLRGHVAPASECGNNPLNRLCLKLLDWDIFSSTSQDVVENLPTVPITFDSYRSYVKTWEPLLIEEMRASILSNCPVSSFDKNTSLCSIQLPSDLDCQTTPLITVMATPFKSEDKSMKSSTASDRKDSSVVPVHMDIVLLSPVTPPTPSTSQQSKVLPHGFVNISRTGIRKVLDKQQTDKDMKSNSFLAIVSAPSQGGEISFTFHRKRVLDSRKNKNNTKYEVAQYRCKVLTSLHSNWREFLALHEAYRMPLLRDILQPAIVEESPLSIKKDLSGAKVEKESYLRCMDGVGDAFNDYIHNHFNESQQRAVHCAVDKGRGFSLIQGPPGTGKVFSNLMLHVSLLNYCFYLQAKQLQYWEY